MLEKNHKLIFLKNLIESLVNTQSQLKLKYKSEEMQHYLEGQIKAYEFMLSVVNMELGIYE